MNEFTGADVSLSTIGLAPSGTGSKQEVQVTDNSFKIEPFSIPRGENDVFTI